MTEEKKKAAIKSEKENRMSSKGNVIWILLSIIFGFVGGGIAWLVLRKRSASTALIYLLTGAGVTVLTGAGIFLTLLTAERPDVPKYTLDQVLSAAQQMSPECSTVHT